MTARVFAGTLGFRCPNFRSGSNSSPGYDWHSVSNVQSGGAQFGATGHATLPPSGECGVRFSHRAGLEISTAARAWAKDMCISRPTSRTRAVRSPVSIIGIHVGGIGGTSFEIAPDADLFLDYRYRHVNASVESFSPSLGPVGDT